MGSLYKDDKKYYFAASNTKDGFVSYFNEIFCESECDRLFILKGGPGVGKSTFIKKLGQLAEEKKFECEYFLCSSDPDSYDGIIIKDKRIAVVDGTKPHALEPLLAGVREIIIDLGRSWDLMELYSNKNKIKQLSLAKADCYKDAYKYLYSKSVMDSLVYNLVFPYIMQDKLKSSTERLFKNLFKDCKKKADGKAYVKITRAVSSKGIIRLSTFEDTANFCIFLKEPFENTGASSTFLLHLLEKAKKTNTDVFVSYSPFDKDIIDALYFPDINTSISLYDEEYVARCDRKSIKCRIINCTRFIDEKSLSHLRPLRKFYEKLSNNMLLHATDCLEKAGKAHMETEKIYRLCTDYKTVEKISDYYFKLILQ